MASEHARRVAAGRRPRRGHAGAQCVISTAVSADAVVHDIDSFKGVFTAIMVMVRHSHGLPRRQALRLRGDTSSMSDVAAGREERPQRYPAPTSGMSALVRLTYDESCRWRSPFWSRDRGREMRSSRRRHAT